MLKAVIDINVIVSGLLKNSSSRKILKKLQRSKFTLVISAETLDELIGVIARPKFHKVIAREAAERLMEVIKTQAVFVTPGERLDIIPEDPDDDRFLEAAIASKADFLISGDKHLLKLKAFRNIPIISPAKFLKILSK